MCVCVCVCGGGVVGGLWEGVGGLVEGKGVACLASRTVNKNKVNMIGTLRSHDGDGNEKFKKAIGLISKTTILPVITLFCTFLCRHCKTTT